MIALGIEGTAHTCGVGIVNAKGDILANEIKMYKPEKGGIHPREAANHHAEHLVPIDKGGGGEGRDIVQGHRPGDVSPRDPVWGHACAPSPPGRGRWP